MIKQPRQTLNVLIIAFCLCHFLSGCTAIAIVDAAASTAIGTTKVAVKTTDTVVDVAIPDKDED